mgnify:CR=1 FL=1
MHFVKKNTKEKRLDFVKKLKKNKILRVPGAYNPLTAKLIEEITAMQKRLDYYYKTGLDAPSLTSEFTGP